VSDAEGALTGHQLKPTLIEDAARATVEALTVDDDPQFPSGYRKLLLTTVLQRALETAAQRGEQQRVN
jgi:CO/xanthine dehydrogenase FAD-binding subunit